MRLNEDLVLLRHKHGTLLLGRLLSPLWGEVGSGGLWCASQFKARERTPIPVPSPQGGRERAGNVDAPLRSWKLSSVYDAVELEQDEEKWEPVFRRNQV